MSLLLQAADVHDRKEAWTLEQSLNMYGEALYALEDQPPLSVSGC